MVPLTPRRASIERQPMFSDRDKLQADQGVSTLGAQPAADSFRLMLRRGTAAADTRAHCRGLLVVAGVSRRLTDTSVMPAMAFLLIGLLVRPLIIDEVTLAPTSVTLRPLAEASLAVVLFAEASRIKLHVLRREYAVPLRLLAIGRPLTIAQLNAAEAVVLAVLLAPTAPSSTRCRVRFRHDADRVLACLCRLGTRRLAPRRELPPVAQSRRRGSLGRQSADEQPACLPYPTSARSTCPGLRKPGGHPYRPRVSAVVRRNSKPARGLEWRPRA